VLISAVLCPAMSCRAVCCDVWLCGVARRPLIEGHHLVLGVWTAVLFTAAVTNIIKCPVGRLRPDFNARWGHCAVQRFPPTLPLAYGDTPPPYHCKLDLMLIMPQLPAPAPLRDATTQLPSHTQTHQCVQHAVRTSHAMALCKP
jgi:hypothetical protein